MTGDFNVAVAVKEHPVALVAGAVYPRWARGDSKKSGRGLDTRDLRPAFRM